MDRRTKFILLVLASIALFAAVGWFIVWPTIAPLFSRNSLGPAQQPPALPATGSPQTPNIGSIGRPEGVSPEVVDNTVPAGGGAAAFTPTQTADMEVINGLIRRAGVLAERVESGASSDGFSNLTDAQLNVSSSLAAQFRAQQEQLRATYPQGGALYLTTARRLTAEGENGSIRGTVFRVTVQLQVTTRDMASASDAQQTVSYRRATVTFTDNGREWVVSGYASESFQP